MTQHEHLQPDGGLSRNPFLPGKSKAGCREEDHPSGGQVMGENGDRQPLNHWVGGLSGPQIVRPYIKQLLSYHVIDDSMSLNVT